MKPNRAFLTSFVVIAGLAISGCAGGGDAATSTPTTTGVTPASNTGKAVYGVSDAAADMGTVTSVKVTIDSIKVHGEGGAWTTVSTEAKTFDLLELKAKSMTQLMAQADLKAGTYDQIEVNVSKAVVVDAKGSHDAKLPSNKLQFKSVMQVTAGATSTADLDFQTSDSVHMTGEGTYILAPVIQVETRAQATAQVQSGNVLQITGGTVTSDSRVGMDIQGNVAAGLMISPGAVLTVTSGKVVQTKGEVILGGTIKSVDSTKNTITITSSNGTEVVLNAAANTTFNLDASVTSLVGLGTKVGSETVVKYDAESKALVNVTGSAQAAANAQAGGSGSVQTGTSATITGTIKAVDTTAGTITVVTAAGTEMTLKVASDSTVKVDGAASTTADLKSKIGSSITAQYNTQTNAATSLNAGTSASAGGSASASSTIAGSLKAVDVLAGTITIKTQAGTDLVLKVASDTKVTVNGTASSLGSLATKVGSQVNASYNAQTNAAVAVSAS